MVGLTSIAIVLAWVLIGLGVVCIFLPFAPSIPLIWFGVFVYAVSHGFDVLPRTFMAWISAIAIATIFLDFTLNKFGIYKVRVGAWAVVGAIIGAIAGSFFSPWFGYVIGPVLGAIIFEIMSGHDQVYAFNTGNTTIVAFMGGTIVKFIAAVAMIGLMVMKLRGQL
jgi:hypothetical protein